MRGYNMLIDSYEYIAILMTMIGVLKFCVGVSGYIISWVMHVYAENSLKKPDKY